jgi:hypothetical protein
MDVRLPDGTIIRGVPDGTTREELASKLKANGYSFDEPKPKKTEEPGGMGALKTALRMATPAGVVGALFSEEGRQDLKNAVAGGVRGAGSIGATLLYPIDAATDAIKGDRRPNVSGLVTGQQPVSRNAERRAQMDEALSGLGADRDSLAFQTGKIATEVAGTYPVGGLVGRGVATVAPRLGQAITSGGLSTGARVAPGVLPAAADLGVRVAGGAISGGATAGLINPEDADIGAALGGAIPAVTKLAGAAGRVVGNAVSPRMARNNAANKLAASLGDDAQQVVSDIQTYYPRGAESIPVSAAAATKNAKLAQLEQGSRLRSSPQWHDFDVKQARAAYDNVLQATDEAGELGARAAARQENWTKAWEAASAAQKPRVWQKRMTQFGSDMETALRSPESSNPNVRAVLEAINSEMDRVGPDFSIGHLQQLRANLNGKVQPMSSDAFKAAPRDNPAIISIKKEMDAILNGVTGGKWQKVIEGYAKDSEALHASKAAQKVRNAYVDAETGRIVSPVINADVPRVTAANLSNAMNAARLPDKSLALGAEANQRLEATVEALRRQAMVQELKRTATAGGGSDTVSNALQAGAQAAGAPNMLMQLIGGLRQLGAGKTDNALAQLLANPDELAAVLAAMQRPQSPNRLAAMAQRTAPALVADR